MSAAYSFAGRNQEGGLTVWVLTEKSILTCGPQKGGWKCVWPRKDLCELYGYPTINRSQTRLNLVPPCGRQLKNVYTNKQMGYACLRVHVVYGRGGRHHQHEHLAGVQEVANFKLATPRRVPQDHADTHVLTMTI